MKNEAADFKAILTKGQIPCANSRQSIIVILCCHKTSVQVVTKNVERNEKLYAGEVCEGETVLLARCSAPPAFLVVVRPPLVA